MKRHPTLDGYCRIACALLVAAILGACQTQPKWAVLEGPSEGAYPAEHWAKASAPEDLGWSSEKLAQAREFSEIIGSTAVMIIQDGVVVDAWGEVAVKSNLHSVRKSLLSALISIAVEEGKIDLSSSMEELGIDDNEPSLTEAEKQATVGDLIKARSGVYHAALYESKRMTESKPPRGSHQPGVFWHYNNWDFNALGTIYEQQTGEKIFEAFDQQIAEPLQMEDFEVDDGEYVTGDASIHSAYLFRMTARDLGRFALLYLRDGRWHEKQIVPAGWVAESTESHSRTSTESGYGYMWWTGHGEGLFSNVRISSHSYYAAGWHGQLALVFPHLDLVVIHRVNTDHRHKNPPGRHIGRLLWMILAARGETDIGPDPGIEAAVGERLDSAALQRTLSGASGTGTNRNGSPWRVTFGADGNLSGVGGWNQQHSDKGQWRVEEDRYCRQWDVWSGGEDACYTVLKEGQVLKIFDATGTFRGSMTLETS